MRSTSRKKPTRLRDRYGRNTFGQSCLLARRLIEAGTRVVEVIWPKVANSDNHSWDHHVDLTKRMKTQSGPMLDAGLSGSDRRHGQARPARRHAGRVRSANSAAARSKGVSTSGNSNSADGRDHWPYCYTAVMAGAGIKRGYVHGKSDETASVAARKPGPPDRTAGDDLPRPRHRPGDDRLQPPQPAARAGEGASRDGAVCVTKRARNTAAHLRCRSIDRRLLRRCHWSLRPFLFAWLSAAPVSCSPVAAAAFHLWLCFRPCSRRNL